MMEASEEHPDHELVQTNQGMRPWGDLRTADNFRESVKPKASMWQGLAPLWHGWVIVDAYFAGIDYQKSKNELSPDVKELLQIMRDRSGWSSEVNAKIDAALGRER